MGCRIHRTRQTQPLQHRCGDDAAGEVTILISFSRCPSFRLSTALWTSRFVFHGIPTLLSWIGASQNAGGFFPSPTDYYRVILGAYYALADRNTVKDKAGQVCISFVVPSGSAR